MGALEALLYVSGEPMGLGDIAEALGITDLELQRLLDDMQQLYASPSRGLTLQFVGERVRLCTKPAHAALVEQLAQPEKVRALSQSMLETLAIVAYKQPVTRAEIEAVRGVRCEYMVRELLQMGFIMEVGRKDAVGRPVLLGTTERFLLHFGLTSLGELPSRDAFSDAPVNILTV